MNRPTFLLGQVLITPGAIELLRESGESPAYFLARHAKGDWGEVCHEDKRLNDQAVMDGTRILSAYRTNNAMRLWIITEAADDDGHRAATTILLPDEY